MEEKRRKENEEAVRMTSYPGLELLSAAELFAVNCRSISPSWCVCARLSNTCVPSWKLWMQHVALYSFPSMCVCLCVCALLPRAAATEYRETSAKTRWIVFKSTSSDIFVVCSYFCKPNSKRVLWGCSQRENEFISPILLSFTKIQHISLHH